MPLLQLPDSQFLKLVSAAFDRPESIQLLSFCDTASTMPPPPVSSAYYNALHDLRSSDKRSLRTHNIPHPGRPTENSQTVPDWSEPLAFPYQKILSGPIDRRQNPKFKNHCNITAVTYDYFFPHFAFYCNGFHHCISICRSLCKRKNSWSQSHPTNRRSQKND